MADYANDVIKYKIWLDYGLPLLQRPRILISNTWAFYIVSLIGVWMTIWAHQCWKLFQEFLYLAIRTYIVDKEISKARSRHEDADSDWEAGLPPNAHLLRTAQQIQAEKDAKEKIENHPVTKILFQTPAPEKAFVQLLGLLFRTVRSLLPQLRDLITSESPRGRFWIKAKMIWQNETYGWKNILLTMSAIFACATSFFGLAATATAVTFLQLDNIALADSPNCGVWLHPNSTEQVVFALNKAEGQTASYYRRCYEYENSIQECNLFAYKDLHNKTTDNDDCPFDGDVCLLGKKSAISFDTGDVDSKYLGINSPQRPSFRRRMSCAPLVTDGYKVMENIEDKIFRTGFTYGPGSAGNNYTWIEARIFDFPSSQAPAYKVVIKRAWKDFVPFPEFTSSRGHTTLLFIVPFNVQYPQRSEDPIFPARKHISTGNDLGNYWLNREPHSGVLGCVESATICTSSKGRCGDPWVDKSLLLESDETIPVFWAMYYSGFWSTIRSRTALELDASSRVIDAMLSVPLAKEQWKIEARRLFEMGLVRAQLEALEVARGTRAELPGFVNYLEASRRGICHKVRFQAKGYSNLSVVGLLFSILGPFIVGLLASGKDLSTQANLNGVVSRTGSVWRSFIHLVAWCAGLISSAAMGFTRLLTQGSGTLFNLVKGRRTTPTAADGASNADDGSVPLSGA